MLIYGNITSEIAVGKFGGFFEFHNGHYPFFDRFFAEMGGERRYAAHFLFHADKRHGVVLFLLFLKMTEDGFIAGYFNITVGNYKNHPHHGIEPVNAQGGGEELLRNSSFCAKRIMRPFPKGFIQAGAFCEKQANSPIFTLFPQKILEFVAEVLYNYNEVL